MSACRDLYLAVACRVQRRTASNVVPKFISRMLCNHVIVSNKSLPFHPICRCECGCQHTSLWFCSGSQIAALKLADSELLSDRKITIAKQQLTVASQRPCQGANFSKQIWSSLPKQNEQVQYLFHFVQMKIFACAWLFMWCSILFPISNLKMLCTSVPIPSQNKPKKWFGRLLQIRMIFDLLLI